MNIWSGRSGSHYSGRWQALRRAPRAVAGRLRRRWRSLVLLTLLGVALPPALVMLVGWATARHRHERIEQVPPRRVALVFGAGVRPDGRLSPMLADRVQAAIALYDAGRVSKILMTGDNGRADYDEVTAMRGYAVARGVPEADITLDYAGFSTYESCYRARAIFGVDGAVLVTQRYHLPRAVYTCRQFGIDAVGLGTADWGAYPARTMVPYSIREALATLKALWQVHITRPEPTFLGPFEGIT